MKLLTGLIAIFIVLGVTIFISEGSRRRDKETYDNIIKQSEKREKILKSRLDSLQSSYKILEDKYNTTYIKYKEVSKEVDIANKRYEKIRNSKPTSYTDKQIDSILNRYYPKP